MAEVSTEKQRVISRRKLLSGAAALGVLKAVGVQSASAETRTPTPTTSPTPTTTETGTSTSTVTVTGTSTETPTATPTLTDEQIKIKQEAGLLPTNTSTPRPPASTPTPMPGSAGGNEGGFPWGWVIGLPIAISGAAAALFRNTIKGRVGGSRIGQALGKSWDWVKTGITKGH